MYCPHCDHEIYEDDLFCPTCGAPLGPPEDEYDDYDDYLYEEDDELEAVPLNRREQRARDRSRRRRRLGAGILGIILLLVLAGLSYPFLKTHLLSGSGRSTARSTSSLHSGVVGQQADESQAQANMESTSSTTPAVEAASHLAIGATLNAEERRATQALLGAEGVSADKTVEVDGPMVDHYLHDGSTAKTRVFSSLAIIPRPAGSGIQVEIVTPAKITKISNLTYHNAAINSGIKDALIRVATLHEVSGEGALVGLYALLNQSGIGNDESYQNTNDQLNLVLRLQEETGQPQLRVNEFFINLRQAVLDYLKDGQEMTSEAAEEIVLTELRRLGMVVSEDLFYDLVQFVIDFAALNLVQDDATQEEIDRLDQELNERGRQDLLAKRQQALEILETSGSAGVPQEFLTADQAAEILKALENAALSGQVVTKPGLWLADGFLPEGYFMSAGSQMVVVDYLEALIEFYEVEVDRELYPYSLNWHEMPRTAELARSDDLLPQKVQLDRPNHQLIFPDGGHRNISGAKTIKLYHHDTVELTVVSADDGGMISVKVNTMLVYEDPENPSAHAYERVYVYRKHDGRLAMAVPDKYNGSEQSDRFIELCEVTAADGANPETESHRMIPSPPKDDEGSSGQSEGNDSSSAPPVALREDPASQYDLTLPWRDLLLSIDGASYYDQGQFVDQDFSDTSIYHPIIPALYQRLQEKGAYSVMSHTFLAEVALGDRMSQADLVALNYMRFRGIYATMDGATWHHSGDISTVNNGDSMVSWFLEQLDNIENARQNDPLEYRAIKKIGLMIAHPAEVPHFDFDHPVGDYPYSYTIKHIASNHDFGVYGYIYDPETDKVRYENLMNQEVKPIDDYFDLEAEYGVSIYETQPWDYLDQIAPYPGGQPGAGEDNVARVDLLDPSHLIYQGTWEEMLNQLPDDGREAGHSVDDLVAAAQQLAERSDCHPALQAMAQRFVQQAQEDENYGFVSDIGRIYMHTFLLEDLFDLDDQDLVYRDYLRTIFNLTADVTIRNDPLTSKERSVREDWLRGLSNGNRIFFAEGAAGDAARVIERATGFSPYFIVEDNLSEMDGYYTMTPMTVTYIADYPFRFTYNLSTREVGIYSGVTQEHHVLSLADYFDFEAEYGVAPDHPVTTTDGNVESDNDILALSNPLYTQSWQEILSELPDNGNDLGVSLDDLVTAAGSLLDQSDCHPALQAMVRRFQEVHRDNHGDGAINFSSRIYMHTFQLIDRYDLTDQDIQYRNYFRAILCNYIDILNREHYARANRSSDYLPIRQAWLQGLANGDQLMSGTEEEVEAVQAIERTTGYSPYVLVTDRLDQQEGYYILDPTFYVEYHQGYPFNYTYNPTTQEVGSYARANGSFNSLVEGGQFDFEAEYPF